MVKIFIWIILTSIFGGLFLGGISGGIKFAYDYLKTYFENVGPLKEVILQIFKITQHPLFMMFTCIGMIYCFIRILK